MVMARARVCLSERNLLVGPRCDRPRSRRFLFQASSGAGEVAHHGPLLQGPKGDLSVLLNAVDAKPSRRACTSAGRIFSTGTSQDSRDVRRWSAGVESPSVSIRRVTEITRGQRVLVHLSHQELQVNIISPGNWGRILRMIEKSHTSWEREAVLEAVREAEFPFKPSRFESAYAFIDLVAARWWHRHERQNDFGHLVDVVDWAASNQIGDMHGGQANVGVDTSPEVAARRYWTACTPIFTTPDKVSSENSSQCHPSKSLRSLGYRFGQPNRYRAEGRGSASIMNAINVIRIYKEIHGDPRWCWSINASPYPAPPSNTGVARTLDAAKQEFKTRYEEMKRMELDHLANT
jgi:hypothetical protein